jgi:hypothetical protein
MNNINQKVKTIVILIVLAIILIGVVGYLILTKKPTPATSTSEKVRSYDLKFDRGSIEYLRLGLSENGKYGYIVFLNKKDNKSYIQINNQTYGPYDDVSNFIFTKDNKAYIIYTKDNKMTIEQID